jgi:hypothetical protein
VHVKQFWHTLFYYKSAAESTIFPMKNAIKENCLKKYKIFD